MIFNSILQTITQKLIMIPIVLIALTFHELAHGFVSSKLGDPTPRLTGRLTLNPLAHLDPVGTILMVLTGFGWAKPVQINPRYYKDPKKGMALTAAAGPLANLLLAVIAMLIYTAVYIIGIKTGAISATGSNSYNWCIIIENFLYLFARVNLTFMVFNFIPIPPLDGSRILGLFLPSEKYFKLQQFERYSFMLIILLSFIGAFDLIIGTGVRAIMTGILNICSAIVQAVI